MGVQTGAVLKTSNTFMRFPMKKMYVINGRKWEFKLVAPPDLQYCTKSNAKNEQYNLAGAGHIVRLYKRAWIDPQGHRRTAWVCYSMSMKKQKRWEG